MAVTIFVERKKSEQNENRDGHLAGLIEAKPEVLGKIYPYRKAYLFWFSLHKARKVTVMISVERKKSEQTLLF